MSSMRMKRMLGFFGGAARAEVEKSTEARRRIDVEMRMASSNGWSCGWRTVAWSVWTGNEWLAKWQRVEKGVGVSTLRLGGESPAVFRGGHAFVLAHQPSERLGGAHAAAVGDAFEGP